MEPSATTQIRVVRKWLLAQPGDPAQSESEDPVTECKEFTAKSSNWVVFSDIRMQFCAANQII